MEILKLINIKKDYKYKKLNQKILNNISFSFNKGEIIAILGESGSGKSTLLNIISGIDQNFEGEVLFVGNNIKQNIDEYRKKHVGFIFQNFNLIPYLNIIENVEIPLLLTNIGHKKRRKMAKEALMKVGLIDQMLKKPNELSGGEKQRVAIARAIVKKPKILICDEPTGSLDSNNTREILNIFLELSQNGHTIIIATHSNQVCKICNRVIDIKDGQITNTSVLNEYLEFFEEKPINIKYKKISFTSTIGISIKNYIRKPTRNILVSIGTSISLMALLIVLSLSSSIKKYINEVIDYSNNNKIVEIYNEKQTGSNIISKSFTINQITELNGIKGIEKIDLGYNEKGIFHIYDKEYRYDFDNIKTYSIKNNIEFIMEGRYPNEGEIVLNYYMYEKIYKNIINDYVVFKYKTQEKQFKIVGIYEDAISESTIYFNYNDIKEMFSIEPNVAYLYTSNQQEIKREVTKKGYFFSYIEESLNIFNDSFDIVIYLLSIFTILSLIISFIMIIVVLYISVLERTREIGILRAFGFVKKDIKKMFLSDGVIFGIISGILGIGLSTLIILIVDNFIKKSYLIELKSINAKYILFIIIISIFISLFSSVYPSKKASKLNVVDALRYE